ncbi:MAG TPA: AIR synthase-related protein, partial [Isosphaeraceae bacterium]|nr:AIR synthase-related protein [Isosphaeraceae bacterium]
DSLNNEYTHEGRSLAIPPTLLISAIAPVPDVRSCITMDLKEPGNVLVLLGLTRLELGGSLWAQHAGATGGRVPRVDPGLGNKIFAALHEAIGRRLVRSCHDLSEGGLAVALAEMALAGGLGASVSLGAVPHETGAASDLALLFSESLSRFLLEVAPKCVGDLTGLLDGLPMGRLGFVTSGGDGDDAAAPRLIVRGLGGSIVLDGALADLKTAWQRPLRDL